MNQNVRNIENDRHQKLLFKGLEYFRKLKAKYQNVSLTENNDGLIISFNDLSFYIQTVEDFHILTEVFYDDDYHLISTDECVIFDIGMNIGLASLFFAKQDFVKKVYGFEPVTETYKHAQCNFSLNKKYSYKVQPFNYGLGSIRRKDSYYFHREAKGNCGISGLKSPSLRSLENHLMKIEVDIKEICDELKPLIEQNKQYKKFIKLDCEGSEYEILEKLDQENYLQFFDGLMIEWHDYGSFKLENILLKNNFLMMSKYLNPLSGMIYAFRSQ